MSTFLYLAIEGRPHSGDGSWRLMQRMENPGCTSDVHGLLGLDDDSSNSVHRLGLRGLPAGVDDETLAEGAYFVDDALAATNAGDCVDSRFCFRKEAKEWSTSGRARLLAADRVTSPDAFGHSWATADELERILKLTEGDSAVGAALWKIVATMRYLHEADIDTRAIYWFE